MGAARVLLTRTAAKGAGFARALSELARQRGEPAPNVLYAPVHVPRTVAYTPELSAALQATAADQVGCTWLKICCRWVQPHLPGLRYPSGRRARSAHPHSS